MKLQNYLGTLKNKINFIFIKYPFTKNKIFLIPAGVLFFVAIFFLYLIFKPVMPNIPTYQIKKGKFLVSITESGEIRAKNSISIIAPRIRGNLKITYLIPEGTFVKAGDTILLFDPTELLNNMRDAEARLEVVLSEKERLLANQKSQILRAENELKNSELSLSLSKLSLEQMKFEAAIKQQETKLQLERNELNLIRARQDLASTKIVQQSDVNKANIDIQQKKSDLDKAKKDLEQLTVFAPTDGLVVYETNWQTGRKIQIGDAPWQGMTIMTLPDLSLMQSVTNINEVDVSNVRKGQSVIVKLDAFQDSLFYGSISKVASLGKPKEGNSGIKVFEIEVDINGQSEILKPGMTSSNKIVINEIENVISVPQEAVFDKFGKKVVYLKNGSGFSEKIVETGEKSDNFIVISKGVEENQLIALRDPNVEISKQTTSEENTTKQTKKSPKGR